MTDYYGKIEITAINNMQVDTDHSDDGSFVFTRLEPKHVQFIHYPDCQQLCIWLPYYGREYGKLRLYKKDQKEPVQEWEVTDLLSGSIQLIWDTLPVPVGDYVFIIEWKNGWQHHVIFSKHEVEVIPVKPIEKKLPQKEATVQSKPIVYKDGYGREIVEEDTKLRAALKKDIVNKFTRHLEYDGNFRAGTIIYHEGDTQIRFSHEMGGGNCMFYIDIPSEEFWEARTKTTIKRRKDILNFVATQVQAKQAPNSNFVIDKDVITFYYK
jgi:hypothetical protein